jgi:hypothetical protein
MLFSSVMETGLRATALWQGEDPFGATSSFLTHFFFNGIGYWFYFLLLALAALIWVYYDSSRRKLDAVSWRIGTLIAVGLLIPSIFFKFSVLEKDVYEYFNIKSQISYLESYQEPADWRHMVDDLNVQLETYPPLTGAVEPIMYMGILGGMGAPILAIAYYVTFQGQMGSSSEDEGYYQPPPPPPPPVSSSQRSSSGGSSRRAAPPPPVKPKAHAWLVTAEGRSYQLNQGTTTLGRSAQNDIQIDNDSTVSKGHAKIVEENNHFRFYDLGSTNGSRINNKRVRQPMLLAADDQIRLGDNTQLRFVTSQR